MASASSGEVVGDRTGNVGGGLDVLDNLTFLWNVLEDF